MAGIKGMLSITGLPPHRGLIASLCFFEVPAADAPPPHDCDLPDDEVTDCHEIFERVDLDKECREETFEHDFAFDHEPGYYYLQVRVILFRESGGKMFAQAEQFLFGRRPLDIKSVGEGRIVLPVEWPPELLEELEHYGTVTPTAG